MGFTKLDEGIVLSSVWSEPPVTRVVWVTMLAMANPEGFVLCSRSGLLRSANVPEEDFNIAMICLESPDPDSRSPEHDGRRIEKIDGGWKILNYIKYRMYSYSNSKEAIKKRKQRGHQGTSGDMYQKYRDISASASASALSESSLIPVNELRTPIPPKGGLLSLPGIPDGEEEEEDEKEEKGDGLFEFFWEMYPRKVGKGAARKAWKKIKEPGLTLDKIETALAWQKKSERWQKNLGEFLPHPATYLNQERWMDEPQKAPDPAASRSQPMFATGAR